MRVTGRWERTTVSVCVVRFCATFYRIWCSAPYPVIPTHCWLPSWYQCHSCVVLRLESSRSYMPGRSSLCHHHSRVCLCGRRGLSWSPEDEESYSLKHRLDLEVKGGKDIDVRNVGRATVSARPAHVRIIAVCRMACVPPQHALHCLSNYHTQQHTHMIPMYLF